MGFKIVATDGTCKFLKENGIDCKAIKKIYQGSPNIADSIKNKEIQLIINTPATKRSEFDDSYIRKIAIRYKVPYITTTTAALASAKGISAYINNNLSQHKIKSLQEYHDDINK